MNIYIISNCRENRNFVARILTSSHSKITCCIHISPAYIHRGRKLFTSGWVTRGELSGKYRSRGRAGKTRTRTHLVGDPHHQRDLPTELLPVLEAGKEGAEGAPRRSRRGKTQSLSVREGAERARLGCRREQCWSGRHWDRLCCLCEARWMQWE